MGVVEAIEAIVNNYVRYFRITFYSCMIRFLQIHLSTQPMVDLKLPLYFLSSFLGILSMQSRG